MKQTGIRLGPLAILLTVVSICMTILAILTFTTARADLRLAEKYAETVQTRYELELRGQEFLRQLETGAISPEGLRADAEGALWNTLEQDGARLRIGLKGDGEGGYELVSWRQEKEWVLDTDLGDLWNGW